MRPNYQPVTLITAITAVTLTANKGSAFSCGPGTYKHSATTCEPCPDGTYISDLNHDSTDCIRCQIADEYQFEYEAEKCTRTTNTRILCTATRYRRDYPPDPELGQCNMCSVCGIGKARRLTVVIKPCGKYTDTLCCESAEFEAGETVDTSGRIFLQCVANTTNTRTTFSQGTTIKSGTNITSTVSPILPIVLALICILTFKYLIPWHE